MDKRLVVASYRTAFALLTVAAISWQAWKLYDDFIFRPANFFSFFTILSNIFALSVFAYGAYLGFTRQRTPAAFELVRGAAVVYMAITGIVFALLLSGQQEDLQTHIAWVNNTLHKVMPIAVVLDWFIDPPDRRIDLSRAALWLLFPVGWLVYTLVRGPIVDWYPYPFVDPRLHGYDRVAVMSAIITVGFIVVALLTTAIANFLYDRHSPGNPADAATMNA